MSKPKERIVSPEEQAQAREYYRRRSLPGTTVRRMQAGRCYDQFLSNRGSELGSKHETTTRGRVTSVSYSLPPLPAFLEQAS